MKIEIEILPDQLELLEKIKLLPKVIEDHIGKLPISFEGRYKNTVNEICEYLEFACKEWIYETTKVNSDLIKLLDKTKIVQEIRF
jgi:archaellum component FlaC